MADEELFHVTIGGSVYWENVSREQAGKILAAYTRKFGEQPSNGNGLAVVAHPVSTTVLFGRKVAARKAESDKP